MCPTGLVVICGHGREYRHDGSLAGSGFEGGSAVDGRKDRMVDAHTHTRAGMPFGAALANNDVAGEHSFAAELLDAETTASGIATVLGRAACFLVCHSSSSLFLGLGRGFLGR